MDLKVICVVLGLSVFALAGPAVDSSGPIDNSVSRTCFNPTQNPNN